MINDPLLHRARVAPPPPPIPPAAPPATRRRSRHPAVSSRILAVGISTSAMFALTAGYASAEKKTALPEQDDTPQLIDGAAQNVTAPEPATGTPAQDQAAPQQAETQQAPTRVVQVPVAPAAPATPSRNSGGNTQQSSGSN